MPSLLDREMGRVSPNGRGSQPGSYLGELAGTLPLRPYQGEAVSAACLHVADRSQVHLIDMPTGSGKNRTGAALAHCLLRAGYVVLWVSKSWEILAQSAGELMAAFPEYGHEVGRVGGDDGVLRALRPGADGRITYTTLQTWYKRYDALPAGLRARRDLAIIWDEVHWAVDSPLGRCFRACYHQRSVIFGLSATTSPVPGTHVVYRKAPEELWDTVLARPILVEVATDLSWSPDLQNEEFTPASLRYLGADPARNELIADILAGGVRAGRYERVLVFACDITHAIVLARLLAERGVSARAVHSRMARDARETAIREFREGRLKALVNVAMLIEGVDIPEIDGVFLARPTCSRTLITQMIGRGARKARGKDSFEVVEFADRLLRLDDRVVHARDILNGPADAAGTRHRFSEPVTRHRAPSTPTRFEEIRVPGLGTVPIAAEQTFGVEIELTGPAGIPRPGPIWNTVATMIRRRLHETAQSPVADASRARSGRSYESWRVKYDWSAGWEVVSPILLGPGGFEELVRVCDGLTDLVAENPDRLHINHRCGLHVTLATRLENDGQLHGLIKRVQRLEPGLFTLTGPSRLYPRAQGRSAYGTREGNEYCLPLRRLRDVNGINLRDFCEQHGNRYHTINVTHAYDNVQLIEVRLHGGTTEARKIAPWTSLWMQILERARLRWCGDEIVGPVLPGRTRRIGRHRVAREDIVKLLAAEGIEVTTEFERLLVARRAELRESWRRAVPARVESWERVGWYDPIRPETFGVQSNEHFDTGDRPIVLAAHT